MLLEASAAAGGGDVLFGFLLHKSESSPRSMAPRRIEPKQPPLELKQAATRAFLAAEANSCSQVSLSLVHIYIFCIDVQSLYRPRSSLNFKE